MIFTRVPEVCWEGFEIVFQILKAMDVPSHKMGLLCLDVEEKC